MTESDKRLEEILEKAKFWNQRKELLKKNPSYARSNDVEKLLNDVYYLPQLLPADSFINDVLGMGRFSMLVDRAYHSATHVCNNSPGCFICELVRECNRVIQRWRELHGGEL